ncbi:MAG TPA: DUF6152 family protein [Terriglobia bacterium]|nr:DUF6152 family protein [Terriglobia bacterium]
MKWKCRFIVCGAVLGVLSLAATSVLAHHSFAAEFDFNKQITLKGSITKVEWTNPHTYFYVDGKDENGKTGNWAVEGGAPNVLYRQGWKPDTLKIGDQVTVVGSRAKNGMNIVNATSFVLADGRCVFAGSSGPGGSSTECSPTGNGRGARGRGQAPQEN